MLEILAVKHVPLNHFPRVMRNLVNCPKLLVWLVPFLNLCALAQSGVHPGPGGGHTVTNAPLKQISDEVFEIGRVRLDKSKRTVSFPCAVNMDHGLVEYFLVHSTGKTHESVLRTEAEPYHIHVASLLLGAKGATNSATGSGSVHEPIIGDATRLFVSWRTNGVEKRISAEDWIFNLETKSAMTRGDWKYNGSRVVGGAFLAQREGSIVALIADPDAMINNPRPGRDNDQIWQINTNAVPPVGTPVHITIELQSRRDKK